MTDMLAKATASLHRDLQCLAYLRSDCSGDFEIEIALKLRDSALHCRAERTVNRPIIMAKGLETTLSAWDRVDVSILR